MHSWIVSALEGRPKEHKQAGKVNRKVVIQILKNSATAPLFDKEKYQTHVANKQEHNGSQADADTMQNQCNLT